MSILREFIGSKGLNARFYSIEEDNVLLYFLDYHMCTRTLLVGKVDKVSKVGVINDKCISELRPPRTYIRYALNHIKGKVG